MANSAVGIVISTLLMFAVAASAFAQLMAPARVSVPQSAVSTLHSRSSRHLSQTSSAENCPPVDGYTFYQGKDTPDNDLAFLGPLPVAEMAANCSARPDCQAFNNNGWLKRLVVPEENWQTWTSEPCKGLFVKEKENCPPVDGYTFYQGKDSPNNDVAYLGPLPVAELAADCSARPDCQGFNNNGWLKRLVVPEENWQNWTSEPCKGLFVMEKGGDGASTYILADTTGYLFPANFSSVDNEVKWYATVNLAKLDTDGALSNRWRFVDGGNNTVGLQSLNNSNFLSVCKDCAASSGSDFPYSVSVNVAESNFTAGNDLARWWVVPVGKRDTYALRAKSVDLYMGRCRNCQTASGNWLLQDAVFVYIPENELMNLPMGHWYIPSLPNWVTIEGQPDIVRNPSVQIPLYTNPFTFTQSARTVMREFITMAKLNQTAACLDYDNLYQHFLQGDNMTMEICEDMLFSINKTLGLPVKKQPPSTVVVKPPPPKSTNTGLGLVNRGLRRPTAAPPGGRRLLQALQLDLDAWSSGSMEFYGDTSASLAILNRRGRRLRQAAVAVGAPPDWAYVMSSIQDQGNCSSCWAFVMAAMMEATHFLSAGEMVALSAKELLDCTPKADCKEGSFADAVDHLVKKGLGLAKEYKGGQGYVPAKEACDIQVEDREVATAGNIAKLALGYPLTPKISEAKLLELLRVGPIAASVYADEDWWTYAGGVYESTRCKVDSRRPEFNHAVVIVGAGVDEVTGLPYWRLRNSWGDKWGEGGYMRLLRGKGMCGINGFAWQLEAAEASDSLLYKPDQSCDTQLHTLTATETLSNVAQRYGTTISQITLDNQLLYKGNLVSGQQLVINCPVGNWSAPFGTGNGGTHFVPTVATCPPGAYVVSIFVKPSKWPLKTVPNNKWIGTIQMNCSDGTVLSADAQPNFTPYELDGTLTDINGFTSLEFNSSSGIDVLAGVGSKGKRQVVQCGKNQVITGFAAAADKAGYPRSWIVDFQLQCSNPFAGATGDNLQSITFLISNKTSFQIGNIGRSCIRYTVVQGDTWLSVAKKNNVSSVPELIRSNPKVGGALPVGKMIFLPPCVDGLIDPRPKCPRVIQYSILMTLADLAIRFDTTVSKLMLDNKLSDKNSLKPGMLLEIKCIEGQWSEPYGISDYAVSSQNRILKNPQIKVCPHRAFVVSITAITSRFPGGPVSKGYIGTITMKCSDGTVLTIDAQPSRSPTVGPEGVGKIANKAGFVNLELNIGAAIDRLAGVGRFDPGNYVNFKCDPGKKITGFSAGAEPGYGENSNIAYFQVQCRNDASTTG